MEDFYRRQTEGGLDGLGSPELRATLQDFKINELRRLSRAVGVAGGGKKIELVDRLQHNIQEKRQNVIGNRDRRSGSGSLLRSSPRRSTSSSPSKGRRRRSSSNSSCSDDSRSSNNISDAKKYDPNTVPDAPEFDARPNHNDGPPDEILDLMVEMIEILVNEFKNQPLSEEGDSNEYESNGYSIGASDDDDDASEHEEHENEQHVFRLSSLSEDGAGLDTDSNGLRASSNSVEIKRGTASSRLSHGSIASDASTIRHDHSPQLDISSGSPSSRTLSIDRMTQSANKWNNSDGLSLRRMRMVLHDMTRRLHQIYAPQPIVPESPVAHHFHTHGHTRSHQHHRHRHTVTVTASGVKQTAWNLNKTTPRSFIRTPSSASSANSHSRTGNMGRGHRLGSPALGLKSPTANATSESPMTGADTVSSRLTQPTTSSKARNIARYSAIKRPTSVAATPKPIGTYSVNRTTRSTTVVQQTTGSKTASRIGTGTGAATGSRTGLKTPAHSNGRTPATAASARLLFTTAPQENISTEIRSKTLSQSEFHTQAHTTHENVEPRPPTTLSVAQSPFLFITANPTMTHGKHLSHGDRPSTSVVNNLSNVRTKLVPDSGIKTIPSSIINSAAVSPTTPHLGIVNSPSPLSTKLVNGNEKSSPLKMAENPFKFLID
jgi:hypothetical protein